MFHTKPKWYGTLNTPIIFLIFTILRCLSSRRTVTHYIPMQNIQYLYFFCHLQLVHTNSKANMWQDILIIIVISSRYLIIYYSDGIITELSDLCKLFYEKCQWQGSQTFIKIQTSSNNLICLSYWNCLIKFGWTIYFSSQKMKAHQKWKCLFKLNQSLFQLEKRSTTNETDICSFKLNLLF